MRTFTFCIAFLFLSHLIPAQDGFSSPSNVAKARTKMVLSPYSIKARGGFTQFYGELNEKSFSGMAGLSVRREILGPFSANLDFSTGNLNGRKSAFYKSYFKASFNTLELLARMDITEAFSRYFDEKLHFSAYTGLGLLMFNANAYDLSTSERIRFTNSEFSGRNPLFQKFGEPKNATGIKKTRERAVPLGISLDYHFSSTWQLGVDYRFYFVRSDKLDATSGTSLLNPEESGSYSNTPNDIFSFFSLGITHRFHKKPKDKDGDGIPDDSDRCPDVAGLAKFFGCPDSDGDGIPDYVDRCPNEAGLGKNRGCPDTDGDGVPDHQDQCPNEKGTRDKQGCP